MPVILTASAWSGSKNLKTRTMFSSMQNCARNRWQKNKERTNNTTPHRKKTQREFPHMRLERDAYVYSAVQCYNGTFHRLIHQQMEDSLALCSRHTKHRRAACRKTAVSSDASLGNDHSHV